MAIPLATSGGVFTRIGHLGGIIGVDTSLANPDLNEYRGSIMPAKILQIIADYNASPADQILIDNIYSAGLNPFQAAQNAFLTSMQGLIQNTLIYMANADTPLAQQTSSAALALLIEQMTGSVDSVQASVPSAGSQMPVGTPNGNTVIATSVLDGNGLPLQYCFPEELTFTCTADSQTGGTAVNSEIMGITSPVAQQNSLSWLWPQGSGLSLSQTLIDAAINYAGSQGTILWNGNFSTFTVPNQPDNWPVGVGIVGTNVLSSATAYYGAASLEFLGDGSTLQSISQQFNVGSGGTTYKLQPNTPYCIQGWVQCPVAPGAGVLQIELATAATGGSIIADNNSVPNSGFITLSGLTSATWSAFQLVFRTPAVLPANQFLRFRITTAESSGKSVLINRVAMAPMQQLYPGGPYCCIFSNSDKLIKGDQWTVAIGNTYGLFQFLFDRVFNMKSLGQVLPNNVSPSIADSLIA